MEVQCRVGHALMHWAVWVCVALAAAAVVSLVVFFAILAVDHDMTLRTRSTANGTHSGLLRSIPRVLHQTWKTDLVPPKNRPWVQSWRQGLPHWRHVLHTDKSMEEFVRSRFPYYLPVWERLHPFIKRVDTVRYMWMFHYGGLYTDLDTSLLHATKLEGLFVTDLRPPVAFIPAQHSRLKPHRDAASPAFVASDPGHPIWIHMLWYVAENGWRGDVKQATGPVAVTNVLYAWQQGAGKSPDAPGLVFLSEPVVGIGRFKDLPLVPHYVRHHNTAGWSSGNPIADWAIPLSVFEGLSQEISHQETWGAQSFPVSCTP